MAKAEKVCLWRSACDSALAFRQSGRVIFLLLTPHSRAGLRLWRRAEARLGWINGCLGRQPEGWLYPRSLRRLGWLYPRLLRSLGWLYPRWLRSQGKKWFAVGDGGRSSDRVQVGGDPVSGSHWRQSGSSRWARKAAFVLRPTRPTRSANRGSERISSQVGSIARKGIPAECI